MHMHKHVLALTHLQKPPGMTPRQQQVGQSSYTCLRHAVQLALTWMSQTLTTAASLAATASSVRMCCAAASSFADLHKSDFRRWGFVRLVAA